MKLYGTIKKKSQLRGSASRTIYGAANDYATLANKPRINGVTLEGNKTAAQLGLAPAGSDGLTPAVKTALLQLAEKVAYIDDGGPDYYQALYNALYPSQDLLSISADFTQGQTVVYDYDPLDSLKSMLVVTAIYANESTATVPSGDYTLSGTLSPGTSTITVRYGGKSDTFTVVVTADPEAVWIEQLGATGSTANFRYAPFVLPSDTYTYDYSKTISAIEADFTAAGAISVGYCTEGHPTGLFDASTIVYVETLTVAAVGVSKIRLSSPLTIPSGCTLVIGKDTDTALFKYGGTFTNGFCYVSNDQPTQPWKDQQKMIGLNIYRR